MSKFNVCMRVVMGASPSHAWIALHRCVEALSRLTGEPFTAIFARLEAAHSFERQDRSRWPSLSQIQAAGAQLSEERARWLDELGGHVEARRREKGRGERQTRNLRLTQMCHPQSRLETPYVGVWGWRRLRAEQERSAREP